MNMAKEASTPLMQQFHQFKSLHPDAILFMRCGDFYEMFYEDAKTVARELQIVLTSRNKNSENPIPMAGVPHHAYEEYAAKLIQKGYKIAMCEQVEDPKEAKGIVKREVVQVITPGTVTLNGVLNPKSNNFLAALYLDSKNLYFHYLDVSTGEGFSTNFSFNKKGIKSLLEELQRLTPSELLIHKKICEDPILQEEFLKVLIQQSINYQKFDSRLTKGTPLYLEYIPAKVRNASGLNKKSDERFCWEMLFTYMEHCSIRSEITKITSYQVEQLLRIDPSSIRNLELIKSQYKGTREGSLLEQLDQTVTASGARMLKQMLLNPLLNQAQIEDRLNLVEAFYERADLLDETRKLLSKTYDLYRVCNRLLNYRANGRDLIAIKTSLNIIPELIEILTELNYDFPIEHMNNTQSLVDLIDRALVDDPPPKITEGNLFKIGFSKDLDEIQRFHNDADQVLLDLEDSERKKTGLKNLKIKFNKVFGYYFELPKSQSEKLPDYFSRRQTLTNVERFTTEELKQNEKSILKARDELQRIEYQLFQNLRDKVLGEAEAIHQWARFFATLDVMVCFAKKSLENQYVRPKFNSKTSLNIIGGRHPVVEANSTSFVANDLYLDNDSDLIHLITGPNMGGKSTYLRQTAILVIMAQIGCFVPAEAYESKLFDRIFTRVGASDDLAEGKSTFMVEMSETAYLLSNATSNSLVLLDEVGRGTATFDGLSLAWSVIEYIAENLECFTLFATHYHELTQITQLDTRIKNYCVSVIENNDEVIFLHKIKRGSADRSYGIHVAKLAGMPKKLLQRAKQIMRDLESSKHTVIGLDTHSKKLSVRSQQKSLISLKSNQGMEQSTTLEKLAEIDPNELSPMEALRELAKLKELLNQERNNKSYR